MGDNESDEPTPDGNADTPPPAVEGRPAPDAQIGRELRQFFIELLMDHNLKRLQTDGRVGFVDEYLARRRGELRLERNLPEEDAPLPEEDEQRLEAVRRLLNSDDLREMESHIGQITGSRARLLCIVCPPM